MRPFNFYSEPSDSLPFDWSADTVDVATVHYAKLYAGWEGIYLRIGRGMLNWRYELLKDGDWYM